MEEVALTATYVKWLVVAASLLCLLIKMGISWAISLARAIRLMADVIEDDAGGSFVEADPSDGPDYSGALKQKVREAATVEGDALLTSAITTAAAHADEKVGRKPESLWRRILGLVLGSALSGLFRVL